MTEQDNHITPDQNTPDNNTTEQTTTQLNAPHYITKSTQHNTKNLPLQVLGGGTSGKADGLGSVLEIVGDDVMTPVGGYVSYVNGEGVEERISLMEAEERAIDDWWKNEKGEI